jgi:hypothetical protein
MSEERAKNREKVDHHRENAKERKEYLSKKKVTKLEKEAKKNEKVINKLKIDKATIRKELKITKKKLDLKSK